MDIRKAWIIQQLFLSDRFYGIDKWDERVRVSKV